MVELPPVARPLANAAQTPNGAGFVRQTVAIPDAPLKVAVGRPGRSLSIYPATMGYDLQEELDFLSNRVMEPNVFFSGRMLAPAMPRVEDRQVQLALIRDQSDRTSRMRLLMPFSVEKPGFSVGASILRVWANPFGPLGTPLVDAEDAAETLDNLLEALANRQTRLPKVLVMPDLRLNGRFAQLIRAVAVARNLPLSITSPYQRPTLESLVDGETYLRQAVSAHHLREMRRLWRKMEKTGTLTYEIARQPGDIRRRTEEFLALEAKGWKGRKRSALINDRYRAAFAREAIGNLAEADAVRIHTLDWNGRAIASLVVFIMAGEAYTWKTAYDEEFARFSPGKLLMMKVTDWHLDDANILRTDSCAVPDHPIMSRLWTEREEMGTLVIGLNESGDRDVRQVAAQLHLYRNTRNMARILREKIMGLAGRDA
ncbi:GNAT family N-acetyltransferase [Rhizobium sp. SL86]|uniref:GNAT family N-acetyltransferase n=1 Tax=Rhizobium sp. SL86 TaxID=2995148 RepID=UPI002273BC82|nr:GNAT family N-acetyltransferase [Rhizobium sp. SL86]MCY1665804.1 GNAT family N-acetyltransferase [Rhizobium sp. SL86]